MTVSENEKSPSASPARFPVPRPSRALQRVILRRSRVPRRSGVVPWRACCACRRAPSARPVVPSHLRAFAAHACRAACAVTARLNAPLALRTSFHMPLRDAAHLQHSRMPGPTASALAQPFRDRRRSGIPLRLLQPCRRCSAGHCALHAE